VRRAPCAPNGFATTAALTYPDVPADQSPIARAEEAVEQAVAGGEAGARWGARRVGPATAAAGALALLVLLVSSLAPAPAQAIDIPNPLDVIGGGISDVAVGAFDAIIKHLFAPITKLVTVDLIGWLVAVPNFTDGTHVAQLQTTLTAMAGGLLAAVATLSIARYWLIGYAGSGFAALEGLARTVAAAFALALWPWAFGQAVDLTNLFTNSLLGSESVVKPCAEMLAAALGAAVALGTNPLGLFLAITIALVSLLLFLGLLLVKIAVSVSTILVFVGMPMAIVLWPVAPWVLRMVARAFAACLAVSVLWALCFASAAAVSLDAVTLSGGGSAVNKVIQPLVAIVLLYLMIKLPIALARIAMIGSQAISGGFVSRAVSNAAARPLGNAINQHIPERFGGTKHTEQRSSSSSADAAHRQGTSARTSATAKTAAAGAATGGASTAAAAAGAGATASRAGTAPGATSTAAAGARVPGYRPPPTAQAQAAAQGAVHGLPSPSFRQQDFAAEMHAAEHRQHTNPVRLEQARHALASLPEPARHGLTDAVQNATGPGDAGRRELAYRATSGDWTAEQRDAVRTLAAATPDIRAQALASAQDDDTGPAATGILPTEPVHNDELSPGGGLYAGASDRHDAADPPAPAATPMSPSASPSGSGGNGGGRMPSDQPLAGPGAPAHAPEVRGGPVAAPPTPPRDPAPRSLGGDER
jgi:hypothetical protein